MHQTGSIQSNVPSHCANGTQDPKSPAHFMFFPLLINTAKQFHDIQLESSTKAKCSVITK